MHKRISPEVGNMPQPLRDEFFKLLKGKSMETIKAAVSESLAQKRRLYDELERRKLLKLA